MSENIKFKGTTIDAATGYVINHDVKLPDWVKCCQCGGKPTPSDWLKPIDHTGRKLIHMSHIPNAPQPSAEAGWIARNS